MLVLRYASLGSVSEHLLQLRGSVSEPYAVARLLRPLLGALQHLHSFGIVHGDVRPPINNDIDSLAYMFAYRLRTNCI